MYLRTIDPNYINIAVVIVFIVCDPIQNQQVIKKCESSCLSSAEAW